MPRLVSSDGQEFVLSELAAQSCRGIDFRVDTDDGGIIQHLPKELGSDVLAKVIALLERIAELDLPFAELPRGTALDDATGAALAGLGVVGVLDAARLLRSLRWFDARLTTSILAEFVAQLLKGQPADELRELLGAPNDLSDDEKRAALAEPLFTAPPAPSAEEPAAPAPQPERSFSLALDVDDQYEHQTCLERCDARTLRELKAVSSAWRRRVRETLGNSKSAWRQQPIWSTTAEGRALARQLGGGSTAERIEWLKCMGEELDHVLELPGHATALVDKLEDAETLVCYEALKTLCKLDAAVLADHAAVVVAKLDHPYEAMRSLALKILGKVEAAALADHADTILAKMPQFFIDADFDIEATNSDAQTLLGAVAWLTSESWSPSEEFNEHVRRIQRAIQSSVVNVLRKLGANIDARDRNGRTLLIRAVEDCGEDFNNSYHERIEFLLQHGANVDAAATDGTTALSAALKQAVTGDDYRHAVAIGIFVDEYNAAVYPDMVRDAKDAGDNDLADCLANAPNFHTRRPPWAVRRSSTQDSVSTQD